MRIVARQTLSDGWYKLEKVTVDAERPDGTRQTLNREVYHNGPGAAVLPFDSLRRSVLLVRQARVAALVNGDGPMLMEACAGMVEAGDDPATTIRKEIEQETGFRLHDLRRVFTLYMSPGASAEKLHLFVASYGPDDRIAEGGGLPEEGEDIEVIERPLAVAWQMVEAGEIMDAKTVLLLQHLRLTAS